ncbi:MAG: hypothetical protein A2046_11030 [Bacteroidetes bacterium GWA2_30_7]|nr:MAG: hypothetical protein A2046_11030 [Bacteroidetes bacterium GWA2_30_7]
MNYKLKYKFHRIFLILILVTSSFNVFSQKDKQLIRDGNKKYNNTKFDDAELSYRKAIENNPKSFDAAFNLGDALYRQGKYEEAANQFQALSNEDVDKETLSKVYHNLGNSYIQNKKLKEGIEAYKQSLRLEDKDVETKYNLSQALRMLKQEQQQQQQNQDNKDNKEQNKDQQKQEQQKQQDKKDEQKKEQQQPQEQKVSKEQAEQMLKSMDNDEKDLQEKLKKQLIKTQKGNVEKDW